MISSGKSGANASGPTGSLVPGWSGGSSWNGRSGTRLYQLSGSAFSSSRNFVVSMRQNLQFSSRRPTVISLQLGATLRRPETTAGRRGAEEQGPEFSRSPPPKLSTDRRLTALGVPVELLAAAAARGLNGFFLSTISASVPQGAYGTEYPGDTLEGAESGIRVRPEGRVSGLSLRPAVTIVDGSASAA